MRGIEFKFAVVAMSSSVFFLVLIPCQLSRSFAQTVSPATQSQGVNTVVPAKEAASNSIGVPKPASSPMAGTWKYKATTVQPDGTYTATSSTTMKDDGSVWTVSNAYETPDGPVTDVLTLEKATLILRGDSFKHFPKPGRPWAVTIDLKFSNDKVSGHSNRSSGQNKSVDVALAGQVSSEVTLGFLPLADGYTTPFPTWDVQALRKRVLQLKVVGTERVTVPAGTFDAYKVELTSIPADSDREIVWIAKDSHMLVKASEVQVLNGDTIFTTTELVP